jgi:hypothetical protein
VPDGPVNLFDRDIGSCHTGVWFNAFNHLMLVYTLRYTAQVVLRYINLCYSVRRMYNVNEVKQTSFRLPPELLRRLKQACLDRSAKQTEAVMAGIELWIGEAGAESTPKRVYLDDKVKNRLRIRAHDALVTVQNILDTLIYDGHAAETDAGSGSSPVVGDVEGGVRGVPAGGRTEKSIAG